MPIFVVPFPTSPAPIVHWEAGATWMTSRFVEAVIETWPLSGPPSSMTVALMQVKLHAIGQTSRDQVPLAGCKPRGKNVDFCTIFNGRASSVLFSSPLRRRRGVTAWGITADCIAATVDTGGEFVRSTTWAVEDNNVLPRVLETTLLLRWLNLRLVGCPEFKDSSSSSQAGNWKRESDPSDQPVWGSQMNKRTTSQGQS